MIEEFFTDGGDITFDFPANTAGDVYFRVNSMTVVPTGVRVSDADTYSPIAANEVPQWSPADPYYEAPGPVDRGDLPDWIDGPQGLFSDAPDTSSPLVVDLDGDGVELSAFNASTTTTFFDIDGDGFAEQTAWVSADDGLLVRDLNANGTIDDVGELFGSPTVDGFAKLALLDDNGDSIINQYDDAWDSLRIWQDTNGDAVTQDGELLTLSSLDIVSIDLAGVTASTGTVNGNPISHTSTFRYDDDSTDTIADAWFVHDEVNTYYVGDYTLDVEALFLPTLRGFGEVSDLHIAMSQDGDLLDLVDEFTSSWSFASFADSSTLDDDVSGILYEWAGVDAVDPDSRGIYVDARQLEFMEKYFGSQFLQYGFWPDPWPNAGNVVIEAWNELEAYLKAHLIIQAGGGSLFGGEASYDVFGGDLSGTLDLDEDAVDGLVAFATDTGVDTEAYWVQIADFLEHTKGLSNITTTEEGWLDTALYNSGLSDTWDDIVDIYDALGSNLGGTYNGTSGNDTLTGTAGNDFLYGSDGDDTLNGGDGSDYLEGDDGADTLNGGAGHDEMHGGYGDDILNPGAGGDTVYGGYGDDTYYFTAGNDVYSEWTSNGTTGDLIILPYGVTSGDIDIYRANETSMIIFVDGLGSVEIPEFFTSSYYAIETLQFYDTSTIDLTAVSTMSFYGTPGDEYLTGSSIIDETMYGYGGDDTLSGNGGDDIYDGGAGNDTLVAGSGDDTFIISEGFDTLSYDAGGDDTIVIPVGFSAADTHFLKDGSYNLKILVDGLGQMTITSQLQGTGSFIEHLYYSQGNYTVDFADVQVEQRGGDGTDYLSGIESGVSPDDILNGMAGDDYLYGSGGDDTYVFSEGIDVVSDTGGSDDTILFWEDWSPEDITIYRGEGYGYGWDDLILEDTNGNKMIVDSQFSTSSYTIEHVAFSDSTVWDVSAMSIPAWGTSGSDYIGIYDSADVAVYGFGGNDTIVTNTGNDILDGGSGDDSLTGATGNDFYIYSAGLDLVIDSGGTDSLAITGGVTINDISVSDVGYYDIKLTINSGTDEVTLQDFRYSSTYQVDTVVFDDGFATNLAGYSSWLWGTSGNDAISGNSSDNTLVGKDGNDTINAGAGNDAAHGGAGADTIHGDDGDDLLHGGTGDDVIYGDDGLDTLFGGDGADTFVFETASAFNDVDIIKDFSTSDSDVIDIADVLDGYYTSGVDDITEFVQITDNGTDSTLAIDQDGTANGTNFVAVATIVGVTGLTDEAALLSSGNLLAA